MACERTGSERAMAAENARNIVAVLVAMGALVLNDTLVKLVAARLPIGEIIFIRGGIATAVISLIAWQQGAHLPWRQLCERFVVLRLVGEVGAMFFFLSALFRMPIGTVTAIMQAIPLAVTAGAALFFAEPVGWRRWLATAIGFLGVLVIIRPGAADFNVWALSAVAAIAFVTLRDLATRRIEGHIPSLSITIPTAAAASLFGLALWPVEHWSAPTLGEVVMLGGAALLILVAYFLMIVAMRGGEVAVVAPFRYSIVLWALAAGFVVWGEVPDAPALAGTALVIAAGLYTFWRERARD